MAAPAQRSQPRSYRRIKGGDASAVETAYGKKCQRGGSPAGKIKLRPRRAEMQRAALIHQYVNPHVFFFDELAEHQSLKPRVDVPINVAEVVARFVLPEVGELNRRASARRPPTS